MPGTSTLRPVERRVLQLADAGLDDDEIGRRFRKSPRWARLVRRLAEVERQASDEREEGQVLRPIERRVLRWLRDGVDHDEVGERFRRSPENVARIEEYAHYKLAAAG